MTEIPRQIDCVECGGVAHQVPHTIDKAHAQQGIAQTAVAVAPRTVQPGCSRASQGSARTRQRRVERQVLPVFIQQLLDLADRCASQDSYCVFIWLVFQDSAQSC